MSIISTLSDVKVEADFPIKDLLYLCTKSAVNNHTTVVLKATLDSLSIGSILNKDLIGIIRIFIADNIFFSGQITKTKIDCFEYDTYRITVYCISNTIDLDYRQESIFFQDINKSYSEIIKISSNLSSTESLFISTAGKNNIDKPILQYNETGWEFSKRMASYASTVLVVDDTCETPSFCLGFPKKESHDFNNLENSQIVFKRSLHHKKQKNRFLAVPNQNSLLLICFNSLELFSIGDIFGYKGHNLYITKRVLESKGSLLQYAYTLSTEENSSVPLHFNKNIIGLELYGKVVKKSGLAVKVNLEIFDPSNAKTWFNYAPNTNNAMYSIPLFGETVALQWQNHQDEDILVTHCMRNRTVLLPKHTEKHFKTDHKNSMSLLPSVVDFTSPNNNIRVLVNSGVQQTSNRNIMILTDHNIKSHSKYRVRFSSPEMISLNALKNESTISMYTNNIHIKSTKTNVSSDPAGTETPIMLNPKSKPVLVRPSEANKISASIPK